jgi:hypothetical protein
MWRQPATRSDDQQQNNSENRLDPEDASGVSLYAGMLRPAMKTIWHFSTSRPISWSRSQFILDPEVINGELFPEATSVAF